MCKWWERARDRADFLSYKLLTNCFVRQSRLQIILVVSAGTALAYHGNGGLNEYADISYRCSNFLPMVLTRNNPKSRDAESEYDYTLDIRDLYQYDYHFRTSGYNDDRIAGNLEERSLPK